MDLPISVCIGGEAGNGVMSAGLAIAKIASRSGYHVSDYSEYPSIIRGGHNVTRISISNQPIRSPIFQLDCLIALNQATLDLHFAELEPNAIVIFDPEQHQPPTSDLSLNLVGVPINRIAQQIGNTNLMRNTVAVAAALVCLGVEMEKFYDFLAQEFHAKPKIAKLNQQVAQAAVAHVTKNYAQCITSLLSTLPDPQPRIIVSGNQAISLGAISAGMQFASIYPMTPTSSIIETIAPLQDQFNFVYRQPEDEISAVIMAIGASYAGARSLVATASGGFNLMAEGYGLAAITETPLVLVIGQRGGPATGLPTYTEQADLRFILHASQGEFPRIVLSAGDVEEAYSLTAQAFDLADIYQTPVIILVDKHLCECHWSTSPFTSISHINRGKLKLNTDLEYKRFALDHDGISPRSFPGLGNHVLANSDEHNQAGQSNDEAGNRVAQMTKRMTKLDTCRAKHMRAPTLYGDPQAPITIVSWGSNKGAILDAIDTFPQAKYLHITWLSPFPADAIKQVLTQSQYVLDIEANMTAQLAGLIHEHTGIEILDKYLKSDGRPFTSKEILLKLNSINST